ncbi:uncharacterized protein At4g26485-like [Chenopodium quinoa]|uniref:25S rRNA (uridine-N(3))-methyltransferase BMT5-like domain-containing protein n=1 Tax=Chenopodium quinoa TaxID=63459 RepID=A0A803LYF9_CHEQI|nr:uncharacterized protein At4g26485-like [Chenopodium quinoa]
MGQIFSNLWNWICPKSRNETTKKDVQSNNHQTYYVDDVDQNNQLESHYYINISDHFQPVSDWNNNLDSSPAPHVVLDLISESNEEPVIDYGDDRVIAEVVLEKNVTTAVNYVSSNDSSVGKIGPYTSDQRVLLVGEGDFSFSASLAVAFGTSACNIIATSLNLGDFLIKNYRKFPNNKAELETRGSVVLHGVDATKMVNHPFVGSMTFDRVIFNFPHAGKFGKGDLELRMHQKLISGFLQNAKKMIGEDGEIHITSKCSGFFRRLDIPKLGCDQGLYLIQAVNFKRLEYPGYQTKYGFGGDRYFHCNPSKTYKFGLSSN